jgi:hypothetical protein
MDHSYYYHAYRELRSLCEVIGAFVLLIGALFVVGVPTLLIGDKFFELITKIRFWFAYRALERRSRGRN